MLPIAVVNEESEAVVEDSHIVEHDRTHLNAEEHALLKELLRPGVSIEAVIPDNATPEELWKTLDACVRGMKMLEVRHLRVKFIIGKLLLIFENKPSLYKGLGYDTFSDFMKRGVYDTLGLHRASAYESKTTVKNWPQLTPDRYANIGAKKMNVLNTVADGHNANAETWLETAESMKTEEFKNYVEARGFLEVGEASGATIYIPANRAILARWKGFCGDSRVQSVCRSAHPGDILNRLMDECYTEWIARHEDAHQTSVEGGNNETS